MSEPKLDQSRDLQSAVRLHYVIERVASLVAEVSGVRKLADSEGVENENEYSALRDHVLLHGLADHFLDRFLKLLDPFFAEIALQKVALCELPAAGLGIEVELIIVIGIVVLRDDYKNDVVGLIEFHSETGHALRLEI